MSIVHLPVPVQPELAELSAEFAAIHADANLLADGLTDAQFNWRSSAEKWSIAQCIAHLHIVDGLDLVMLERLITEARAKGLTSPGPFHYGWLSSYFVKKMEPPAKFHFIAPDIYIPPPAQNLRVAMGEFNRVQERLMEVVASADGLDLVRIKTPSPVMPFVKFSLGQRLRLIAAHDRRHLYQAWDVRRALP